MPRIKALEQKYRQFDTSQMIRGFQARAGKSQADMAEILGITQQAYSKRFEGQLISLLIIGLGAYLMRGCNEEEVNKHSTTDSNVLGRLYFLR